MSDLRYAMGTVLASIPVMNIYRRVFKGSDGYLKVLMYHDIPAEAKGAFRHQMEFISRRYGFLDPADLRGKPHTALRYKGIRVLLTFDDGFKSNRVVAEEILNPMGIKGIFFIPSRLLEMRNHKEQREYIAGNIFKRKRVDELPEDMGLMDETDLRALIKAGHVIGAHTRNHRMLSGLSSDKELIEEIEESGDHLSRCLKIPVEWFAYPFGQISAIDGRAYPIIQKRYRFCCSGVRGLNTKDLDPYGILRDPVDVYCPAGFLKFIIEDGLGVLYRGQVRRLMAMVSGASG